MLASRRSATTSAAALAITLFSTSRLTLSQTSSSPHDDVTHPTPDTLKPDSPGAWYRRGEALRNLGRLDEAITCYDKALGLQPGYIEAWDARSAALTARSKQEQADKSSAQLLSLYQVLFPGLGLPTPQALDSSGEPSPRLPAARSALTRRLDGNVDSNGDGHVTNEDRNGWVEAQEVWEEVLKHRHTYDSLLEKLRRAGFKDPFEITPAMSQHISSLFTSYHPATRTARAVLLLRSVLPPETSFQVGTRRYFGLSESEGGLGVHPNNDNRAPVRQKLGNQLPKEVLASPYGQRVANRLEYAYLLIVLLRAAGLEAYTTGHVDAHVVISLDGKRYRLEVGTATFGPTTETPNSDRFSIAMQYLNEGAIRADQGRPEEAMAAFEMALALKLDYVEIWYDRGVVASTQGRKDEALRCFDKALELRPAYPEAWLNKGVALYDLGNATAAIECFDRALEFNSTSTQALNNKCLALKQLGRSKEAEQCDDARRLAPR